MQSAALRSAARRAAGAASRRGVATTTEADKEWVALQVKREVRAQMLAAEEERATAELVREAVRLTQQRADNHHVWRMGFLTGYLSFFSGMAIWAVFGNKR